MEEFPVGEWIIIDGAGSIQEAGFTTPRAASQRIGDMYDEGFNGELTVTSRELLEEKEGETI